MDFREFVNNIRSEISEYLLDCEIDQVYVEEVCKNNGIKVTGLIISEKNNKIHPNIYMESYYNNYMDGMPLEDIYINIANEYRRAKERISEENIYEINRENILDNLFLKVVNYDKNEDNLSDIPYIRFHDLAIVFRYLVKIDKDGIASAILKNSEFNNMHMSIEELFAYAKDNTRRLFPPVLTRLDEMLLEKTGEDVSLYGECNLHILTNCQGINGAAYIIYEDIVKNFADSNDTDLFIIPSSIHEILLLPADSGMDKNDIEVMVKEVNNSVVSDLDYLSDNVYYYDRNIGKISL